MKTNTMILLSLIYVFSCTTGCNNKKHQQTDSIEATKEDFAQKTDTPIDEVSTLELKRVGSNQMGYVSVPPEWSKFKDLDENVKDLQYSDPLATTILTMNIFDTSGLSKEQLSSFNAEEAAKNVWKNLENSGAPNVQGNTVKFQEYDDFQLYATYSDGSQLAAWIFKAEDNEIHYIAVESPTDEKFKLAVMTTSKTFSLKE